MGLYRKKRWMVGVGVLGALALAGCRHTDQAVTNRAPSANEAAVREAERTGTNAGTDAAPGPGIGGSGPPASIMGSSTAAQTSMEEATGSRAGISVPQTGQLPVGSTAGSVVAPMPPGETPPPQVGGAPGGPVSAKDCERALKPGEKPAKGCPEKSPER